MDRKTNQKLLALCSAAVLCVGSVSAFETGVTNMAHAATNAVQTHTAKNQTSKKTSASANKSKSPAKKVKKQSTSSAPKQKYKDGTYTGIGETRIGAVEVAVTLKADKITNVQITGYTTHYSISYIDPILPQELIQRQDVNKIDVISGATLSTADFYYAVLDALQKAQQAEQSASSTVGKGNA